ncbi:MAG: Holliday junction resolvase RuvX [Thermoguttaceae bacterium]|nr:Holliday junction resolvase RuvX [Thermoguttaceae bacterium]MDW8038584.1 Holliday junction resolvase RuvX [Thermoguttaceae bacterium]
MSPESGVSGAGRVAGIDFGRVRIGVAITDPGRRIASPYQTYQRRTRSEDAEWFRRLVQEQEIRLFVVGLPLHADGSESQLSRAAREFGQWLQEVTGVPVHFFDERFSTQWAEQTLRQAGLRGEKRRQKVDKLAAQILLTAYLESGQHRSPAPGPLDDR